MEGGGGGQKMPLPAKKVSKRSSERWAPWVDTADMEPCFRHANEFWNYYRESGVGKLGCQGDELSFSLSPSLIGARGMERAESGNQKFRNFPRSSRDEKRPQKFSRRSAIEFADTVCWRKEEHFCLEVSGKKKRGSTVSDHICFFQYCMYAEWGNFLRRYKGFWQANKRGIRRDRGGRSKSPKLFLSAVIEWSEMFLFLLFLYCMPRLSFTKRRKWKDSGLVSFLPSLIHSWLSKVTTHDAFLISSSKKKVSFAQQHMYAKKGSEKTESLEMACRQTVFSRRNAKKKVLKPKAASSTPFS